MTVKCLDKGVWGYLTVGKEYEVLEETDIFYHIIDDSGRVDTYYKSRFTKVL